MMRARSVADLPSLFHHLRVDVQTPGGIDDHDVLSLASGLLHSALRNLHGIAAVRDDRHADLAAQREQLLHRGGALQIRRDQQRVPPFLLEMQRELRAVRRLP